MKAVIYERYGSPDVLKLAEIDKPTPRENELLIKVYATSVTAGDWRMRKADPFLARLYNGLLKPKRVKILGFELAGVVERVGSKAKSFKPGDEVFASCGFKFGASPEYRSLPENNMIAIKPSNITFEEAATIPIGGMTALAFLRQGGVKEGKDVLVYGASGSVGTFAVQIAKAYGANVTAVCSTTNVDMVKQIGALKVIDYTREEISAISNRFDIVLDAVGKASKSIMKSLLKSNGTFVSVAGSPKSNPDDLAVLKDLIESGKLKTVIDRAYNLDQIRDAHAYVESFRKKGNVAIRVFELIDTARNVGTTDREHL